MIERVSAMKFGIGLLVSLVWVAGCASQTARTEDTLSEDQKNAPNTISVEDLRVENKGLDERTEKTMTEEEIKGVSIKAEAEKRDGDVLVSYEIKNDTAVPIYVWDRMVGYTGSDQIIDKDKAYVFFEAPATVRVVRANLQLPFDRDVAKAEIPFARLVDAKSKVTGTIVLKAPIQEYSPYYPPPKDEVPQIEKVKDLRLLIGWSEMREGMQILERTIGGEKALAIRGGWPPPYHRLLDIKVPIETELQIHKEPFDRSMPQQ
jgi:hypothetical protein